MSPILISDVCDPGDPHGERGGVRFLFLALHSGEVKGHLFGTAN